MSKSRPNKAIKHKRVLESLRDVIASLPTGAEKQEILDGSKAVIDMLSDLRAQVELLPTVEDMATVDAALAKLEGALAQARAKPILSAAIGLALQKGDHARADAKVRERGKAQMMLESLRALPIDEIQGRLSVSDVADADVRAVAAALGLRPAKNADRDGLVHQIAMSISNFRGYQEISGQGSAPGQSAREPGGSESDLNARTQSRAGEEPR